MPLLALLASLVLSPTPSGPAGDSVRVLFLGNSYTYFNNLPEMFRRLAAARNQAVATRMVAPGGWRLEDHWNRGEAKPALEGSHFDYVVLQDQSTLGMNYYLEGQIRVAGDERFRPSAEQWTAAIKRAGAKPVFCLTWSRKQTPEDQALLTQAYESAAKATGAMVAPVGIAWARVRQRHPDIELYYRDGSHPSSAGTYLAAITLYATIFNQNPAGLPARVVGAPVDLKTEKPEPGKASVLVELPADQATILQEAAWSAHQDVATGAAQAAHVDPAALAPLPAGIALDQGRIQGTWTGEIRFYPVGPVAMQLTIGRCRVTCDGRLELHYRSKDLRDESVALSDLRLQGNQIRFSDSASVGIDGLPVQFRAVETEAGELVGTAGTVIDDPQRRLKALGSWRLRRSAP